MARNASGSPNNVVTSRKFTFGFGQSRTVRTRPLRKADSSVGFILGGAVAFETHTPFALVRKKGKLPHRTVRADYALEYGSATIEIHADACAPGDRVLIVDDLIATGGTLLAATQLFRQLGGVVVGVAAVIDLPELGGSAKLRTSGLDVHTLCEFSETE